MNGRKATPSPPARLLVMISGSGRSLVNLIHRSRDGRLHARVVGVVASRHCPGVDRARELGARVEVIPRDLTGEELASMAAGLGADWVVLAGYLRRVPVPRELEGRIINIHPAILPGDGTPGRFGGRGMHGLHVHRAVIGAGEAESGCSVHLVTEAYDAGPVLAVRRCPVLPGDTPESLAARVFELELEALPGAINALALRGGVGGESEGGP